MEKAELRIEGMTCGHCVAAVERALKAVEGVEVERVEIGSAVVAHDPERVGRDRIQSAVEDEGYRVTGIGAAS